jgi:DNA-binding PadR family transcriptional regulator
MRGKDNAETQRKHRAGTNSFANARSAQGKKIELTTPDLVLLSLLTERPVHGYQANLELERRDVRDWVGISRPQVYYSLEKLSKKGMIQSSETAAPATGPERATYGTTHKGRAALAHALEREEWATQRDRPPFLTWLALSSRAKAGVVRKQIGRRKDYLQEQLAREKATLRAVLAEVGHRHHEAVWMISLVIEQFKTELKWLKKIAEELPKRGKVRNPVYADGREVGRLLRIGEE